MLVLARGQALRKTPQVSAPCQVAVPWCKCNDIRYVRCYDLSVLPLVCGVMWALHYATFYSGTALGARASNNEHLERSWIASQGKLYFITIYVISALLLVANASAGDEKSVPVSCKESTENEGNYLRL